MRCRAQRRDLESLELQPSANRPRREAHADQREQQRDGGGRVAVAISPGTMKAAGSEMRFQSTAKPIATYAAVRAEPAMRPFAHSGRQRHGSSGNCSRSFLRRHFLRGVPRAEQKPEADAAEHEREDAFQREQTGTKLAIQHCAARIVGIDVGGDRRAALVRGCELVVEAVLEAADVVGARVDGDARAGVRRAGVIVAIRGRRLVRRAAFVVRVLFELDGDDFGRTRYPAGSSRQSSSVQTAQTNAPTPTAANGSANSIRQPVPRRLLLVSIDTMARPAALLAQDRGGRATTGFSSGCRRRGSSL